MIQPGLFGITCCLPVWDLMPALHERFQAVCVILLQWEMVIKNYVQKEWAETEGAVTWEGWTGCSGSLLLKGTPFLFPCLGSGVCVTAQGAGLICYSMRKLSWPKRWMAWAGELCWCTCAVGLEPRGGTWGRAGSRAVRSELCGLDRDSSQWFWTGFIWAQSCHVTVFDERPTQIVLLASLPGALGKCLG